MYYYEVAPHQIIRPGQQSFTYASGTPLPLGQIVSVEIGKKITIGVVIQEVTKPQYATKVVRSIIEDQPLPLPVLQLALWMSSYYATHLATVWQTVLPSGLQKKRRIIQRVPAAPIRRRTKIVLTEEQCSAIASIRAMSPGSAILHGVTGSGKTAVYIELAKQILTQGKSAVILVPEISLTSQVVEEFSHHFDNLILTHSRQTEAERHLAWREALYSQEPQIVIGPRSALFLPLKSIGLIIVDEAHEPTYKQDQSPRYSALRAASILASHHHAKVILGSATPLVADYYLAQRSNRPIIHMTKRAQPDTVSPIITVIDMTKPGYFTKHRFFSNTFLTQIEETLAANHQVLIFHNRRGSASTTLCQNCGWTALCPRCFIPLTLHADQHQLRCHICGLTDKIPTSCPVCHHTEILHKGIGTKLIESEIKKLFPKKIVMRFDGDSPNKESVEQQYQALYKGDIDIIIGTQTIAKGLDLPKLRMVGVVQADAGLSLPDYSASERTFQLIAQVIGRVGRSHHPTNVIVQSYQPTHPAVVDGLSQNYENFYANTIAERKHSLFPPFTYLLKLTCLYKTEATAVKNAKSLAAALKTKGPKDIQIFGPTPAFYERQHDTYRWQLIIKSPRRSSLIELLTHLPPTHWQYDLDPVSLL